MNRVNKVNNITTPKSSLVSSTNSVVPPKSKEVSVVAKADSGASRHYIKEQDAKVLHNVKLDSNGPTVLLPNNASITSTKKGHLPLVSQLSHEATTAHVLPDLHSTSLISLGLTKEKLYIFKDGNLIETGTRNATDGLWDITLTKTDSKL